MKVRDIKDSYFLFEVMYGRFDSYTVRYTVSSVAINNNGKQFVLRVQPPLYLQTFQTIDVSNPEVSKDIDINMFKYIPVKFYTRIEVAEGETALLCFDGKF